MPAPEVLLKSRTGQPAALDQTLGCMTGLFHIFQGHPAFMGRRHSSTGVGIHSVQSQHKTHDSQLHRHDSQNNPLSKVEGTHKKALQSRKQHRRSYSDVSDLAMTPTRTLTDFRTLKDENASRQQEPTPAYSAGTADALAFYNNESLRAAALFAGDSRRLSDLDYSRRLSDLDYSRRLSDLDYREHSTRDVVLPKAGLVDNNSSSKDIRDAILASFQREVERPKSTKTTSDQSLNSSCNLRFLKNRRLDRCQKDRKSVEMQSSSSVYARSFEPSELVDWKDGLRSSASPPRNLSHHNSPERRVEEKKDRGRTLSRDRFLFPSMSSKRFSASQDVNPQDYRHGNILNQDFIFMESPGASDFRETLRPFLAGVQECQNAGPPQESFTSRSGFSSGVNESNAVGVSSRMFHGESCEHSVVPNVIARLMGLEEIPSSKQQASSVPKIPDAKSRGDKFFRGLVQFDPQITRPTSPSPPPPGRSKKYVAYHLEQPSAYYEKEHRLEGAYQNSYPAQHKLEQGLCSSEEDRDYEHLDFVPFHPYGNEHQQGAYPTSEQLEEYRKLEDPTNEADGIIIVTPEKKKTTIRKILEAMRPKVLLKISRRKQAEEEKPQVTKLITKDLQLVEELLEEKQQPTLIKTVTGFKLPRGTENEEPPRLYTTSDTSSVKQMQERQTDGSNSSESSVVKPCILQPDKNKIVVMKPNTRYQDSNAGILPVRHVETASSTSTVEKEMVSTRRPAQRNNEGRNLAKDQRECRRIKPTTPRAAADNTPRSAREKYLESDCESDPSGTAQDDKSNNVSESSKMRTNPRKRNPSSTTPPPRQNGRSSSPEARPLSRSLPGKDHVSGTGEVGRKFAAARAKNDNRATSVNPKKQSAKEEILKKKVAENPDISRLCNGSSLENKLPLTKTEKLVTKETFPKRSASARALSAAAPRKLDATSSRSSTTDAATHDRSNGSNSALLQPLSAHSQTSDSEPVLEHLVRVQPAPGTFKDPHVYIRDPLPDEHKTGGDSVGHHNGDTSQLQNLEACSVLQDEAQPPLMADKVATELREELTTPRGISLHYENLDGKLDDGIDRPSPISVLDALTFGEEFTPSPSSPRHSFPVLLEFATTHNEERHESCNKFLKAQHEPPSAILEDDLDLEVLLSKCAERLRVQVESPETKIRLNTFQSYFKDAATDAEQASVESGFLSVPKAATSTVTTSCVPNKLVKRKSNRHELPDTENFNEKLLECLHSNGILRENNHLLLLDCLEEIMERILGSQSNLMLWAGLPAEPIRDRTNGKQLEQELWIELRDISGSRPSSEDICETVHGLLRRDLIKCHGRQWATFHNDREQIAADLEAMIADDLIEEAVRELSALQWLASSLPLEVTRRRLFPT